MFSSNSNNLRKSVNDSAKGDDVDNLERSTGDVKFYSLSTIIAATGNFSLDHKVGEGGFGSVYKVLYNLIALNRFAINIST